MLSSQMLPRGFQQINQFYSNLESVVPRTHTLNTTTMGWPIASAAATVTSINSEDYNKLFPFIYKSSTTLFGQPTLYSVDDYLIRNNVGIIQSSNETVMDKDLETSSTLGQEILNTPERCPSFSHYADEPLATPERIEITLVKRHGKVDRSEEHQQEKGAQSLAGFSVRSPVREGSIKGSQAMLHQIVSEEGRELDGHMQNPNGVVDQASSSHYERLYSCHVNAANLRNGNKSKKARGRQNSLRDEPGISPAICAQRVANNLPEGRYECPKLQYSAAKGEYRVRFILDGNRRERSFSTKLRGNVYAQAAATELLKLIKIKCVPTTVKPSLKNQQIGYNQSSMDPSGASGGVTKSEKFEKASTCCPSTRRSSFANELENRINNRGNGASNKRSTRNRTTEEEIIELQRRKKSCRITIGDERNENNENEQESIGESNPSLQDVSISRSYKTKDIEVPKNPRFSSPLKSVRETTDEELRMAAHCCQALVIYLSKIRDRTREEFLKTNENDFGGTQPDIPSSYNPFQRRCEYMNVKNGYNYGRAVLLKPQEEREMRKIINDFSILPLKSDSNLSTRFVHFDKDSLGWVTTIQYLDWQGDRTTKNSEQFLPIGVSCK